MAAKKPTVLVTGAAGELASRVISKLGKKYQIVAVDFRQLPNPGNGVSSYRGDMNRRAFEDIFRQHDIDGVIHLGRMESDEQTMERRYNANVLGTQRLFKLCLEYGVKRVVVLSTYFVYGASAFNPVLLTEDAPLKAVGLTKDLVDSVELENLANIYLWKYPQLNMTILRPCNVVGPGVRNTVSSLLSQRFAPVLTGFSPMMQFVHVEDMANAVALAFGKNHPGIYNVAPMEWVSYVEALSRCECRPLYLPSLPPLLPRLISRLMNWKAFPAFLVNYFKYSVIIDGTLFEKTFKYSPDYSLDDILESYCDEKSQ